jgi:D-sedoheptulose 7-phosphate isomerase
MSLDYVNQYLKETEEIIQSIDREAIAGAIELFSDLKRSKGRLFILGIGGSAGNASHAVNDFRKICQIEAYAPTDNVSELTAWTNDDSFDVVFKNWLLTSKLSDKDALLIFSVGGGSKKASYNLVLAMETAKEVGARVVSIVSRDGGAAKKLSNICILVPVIVDERITPHAEGWQGVLWHLIVGGIRDRLLPDN